MITRTQVIKAIKLLRGEICPDPDGTIKQIALSLKTYLSRGEFNWTIESAIECLKLAQYELE